MIQFEHVSFSYDGAAQGRLQDLNFHIKKGECILLTGRSGCGKTTITRLINGLIPEFFSGSLSGKITVDGKNLGDEPLYRIAEKIGSVFQNPKTQFFNMDTDDEIAFGMENGGVPRNEMVQRVKQTADELQINNLLGRSIFSLSGGEKQKIAVASVYAMSPDIYLLDEPSSNLDTHAIEDLRKHIGFLKEQGKTIIIAEHRIYYLKELADRIFYLNQGNLRYIWTKENFQRLSDEERKSLGIRAMDYDYAESSSSSNESRESQKNQLEIQNLSVGYKKKKVLHDLNFYATPGEIVAITGDNGVGKSTFSRTLCGLLKPLSGEIRWNGHAWNEKERLSHAYMVMQDVNYQLFADSVEHECSFGIENPDLELVDKTMKELGLYDYRERHPNTLSGGQKQRIAVAVSMICKKDILIFDEPTSGLDYESMQAVAELMKVLSKRGKIIFVVTHDFEFIKEACNRVIQLNKYIQ